MNIRVYIKLALSAFFWGGSAIAGKYALQVYSPSFVTFFRFFIAALIMFIIVRRDHASLRLDTRNHLQLFIIASAGVSMCYYFYFNGLYHSSAFNAGIIEATIPLLTLLFAALCKMERIMLYQLFGLTIAYVGVGLTITNGSWKVIKEASYNIGDIMLLISTVCFGVYNVLTKRWQIKIPGMVFMFYFFFYGSIALFPWFFNGQKESFSTDINMLSLAWVAILFMSLGGSVIAYLFFNQGIAEIGASRAASFINLVPFITVFLSVIVLRERSELFQWMGAAIILAGVFIANKNPKNDIV
ncbi:MULTISPECIES: DMT family transporter [unclassified Brenneria]|uniref:DMT family transporter n=1 Tax=unclassified Brenneria TaxID=2634434 RepID=UPI0029C22C6C|nr:MULTISPECIES: DMT family transporter [unclassified Brenneria]MDX5627065.1 DMT family transporter [Brenneria sp. L3-3Z]MDX5693585.1 DMT family transporter [Brenneria sp. L4-2C]MEE3663544.1 DMT family transporter [Brenneria sp. g21c3]